jgi:hypothetical protein
VHNHKACAWKIYVQQIRVPVSSLIYADLSSCSCCTIFVCGSLMEHGHFIDVGENGRITLRWILGRYVDCESKKVIELTLDHVLLQHLLLMVCVLLPELLNAN